jgi:hypothetical protein
MSHTSQRRGLHPDKPGREMVVLAMLPPKYEDQKGAGSAMSDIAQKMLEYEPDNWLSQNFDDIIIPDLGSAQPLLNWLSKRYPEWTKDALMFGVGRLSSVVTAVYTDMNKVEALIKDLKSEWVTQNHNNDVPISIVLSGLFDDVHKCCQNTGAEEHTFLHSLGYFGKVEGLPSETELEIMTMCGHGLISINRIRALVKKVRNERITPEMAAEDIARPCVCGIVNRTRAQEIFIRLAETS